MYAAINIVSKYMHKTIRNKRRNQQINNYI